jgi:hypothetical protein
MIPDEQKPYGPDNPPQPWSGDGGDGSLRWVTGTVFLISFVLVFGSAAVLRWGWPW